MHYRVYTLDSFDGNILSGDDFFAKDDAAAIRAARLRFPAAILEIWHQVRKVHCD